MPDSVNPPEQPQTAGGFPTGTVSFLFTDIEGSSTLAQDYPQEIIRLLERHNAILRHSFEAHGGYIFLIVGDAFCCAFHTTQDAVGAALEAQRRLHQETWHPTSVRVRMGIHTGAAEYVARLDLGSPYDGYLTLTHAQRIMSSANGGQILLSAAAAALVRDHVPAQVSLRDLAEVRLKGFTQTERLWQLAAPDLPIDFPALLSAIPTPNNLPLAPTAMIGRQAELAEIVQCLGSSATRLLTLTGPGGIGKTRMVLQAGIELMDRFPQGIYWIDLAPVREPEAVPLTITRSLGLRETNDLSPLDELKAQLGEKAYLLIFDNFEQVTAAAWMLAELLQACPHLKFLTTSREALRLRGERLIPIQPLGLPELAPAGAKKQPMVTELIQYEAVRLFVERAQAVQPGFGLTDENAQAVTEICWRLDGLPLAIELAAVRTRLFSAQTLLERLGNRLNLLRGGARDLPIRQQTLRGAIDWSYELLDPAEKRLFELLSVFPGGSTIPAVEVIAAAVDPSGGMDPLDVLASLVEKSLVKQVESGSGEPRLLMLETIREYAAERLAEDEVYQAAAYQAHAAYYAGFTRDQWQRLSAEGHGSVAGDNALVNLTSDLENVRSAWLYWVGERDLDQLGKILDGLWLLYDRRAWYHSAIDLARDMLAVLASYPATVERTQQEILLQTSLARALLVIKGYTAEVEQAYTRAVELSQSAGDVPELFPALRGLSSLYGYIGQYAQALQVAERIMSMAVRLGDRPMQVDAHSRLGYIHALTGNLRLGLDHLDSAIAGYGATHPGLLRFQVGNNPGVISLNISALLLWMSGYSEKALERASMGQALAEQLNHPYSLAYAQFHTGLLYLWMEELDKAQESAQFVFELAREHEFQVWEAVATCLSGAIQARKGEAEAGLLQVRQGISMYQGLKTPPVFWSMLIFMEAECCKLAGNPQDGINLLTRAFEIVGQFTESILTIEFLRLYGDLLLAQTPSKISEAEGWYLRALENARKEGALMLQLRAALRLHRLWMEQGRQIEGKMLVEELLGRFTESFSTVDVREAISAIEKA